MFLSGKNCTEKMLRQRIKQVLAAEQDNFTALFCRWYGFDAVEGEDIHPDFVIDLDMGWIYAPNMKTEHKTSGPIRYLPDGAAYLMRHRIPAEPVSDNSTAIYRISQSVVGGRGSPRRSAFWRFPSGKLPSVPVFPPDSWRTDSCPPAKPSALG